MTGLIVGMSLRTCIGAKTLPVENHSSGLLNNTSAGRTGAFVHFDFDNFLKHSSFHSTFAAHSGLIVACQYRQKEWESFSLLQAP